MNSKVQTQPNITCIVRICGEPVVLFAQVGGGWLPWLRVER